MFDGQPVLDVHSHIHDISMSEEGQAPRLGYPFWNDIWFIQGLGASKRLQSPIAPGKHSDHPGNRDEDFQSVAESLAQYCLARNIDAQIISPHPLQFHGWMESDILFDSWIGYQNDLAFKLAHARADMFVGACQVPQRPQAKDTSNCLDELERCVTELAVGAVYVSPDPTGNGDTPPMHAPYWWPLYEKCQEYGLPILIHGTDWVKPAFHQWEMGRYFEFNFTVPQSIAAVQLRQHPELFQRFPGLRIIVCHCGGFVDRLGPAAPFLAKRNKEALANGLFYDTAAYDMDFMALAIKQREWTQFAFGSEAPGSGRENRPGTNYTADDLIPMFDKDPALEFLSREQKKAILHDIPANLAPSLVDPKAHNAKARVRAY